MAIFTFNSQINSIMIKWKIYIILYTIMYTYTYKCRNTITVILDTYFVPHIGRLKVMTKTQLLELTQQLRDCKLEEIMGGFKKVVTRYDLENKKFGFFTQE